VATTTDPLSSLTSSSTPSSDMNGLSASRLATGVDFFKLLTAQMSAQDPLQPVDNTQFLTQLAQYTQLQQSMATNQTLSSMQSLQETLSALQTMTQTATLIGKSINYVDPQTGEAKTGNVQGVSAESGLVVLEVDGEQVPLTAVTAVREGA